MRDPTPSADDGTFSRRSRLWLLGTIVVFLAIGAGLWASGLFGGSTKFEVLGKVTIDGQPMEQGSILLVPTVANTGTATGGTISHGNYLLTGRQAPAPGEYKVEIRATKKSGKMVQKARGRPGELMDEMVEAVASRFNSVSQLRVVVKSKRTIADFEVFGE
jgi:hypothetical protein